MHCIPLGSTRFPANHSSALPSGLFGTSKILNRSTTSLKRTSPELFKSRSQEEKIYPTEPFSDGSAFRAYVVRNKELGALDIENWRPFGTLKSKSAAEAHVN